MASHAPGHVPASVPEGHTIHRLALDLADDLAGVAVEVTSPQGETALGAGQAETVAGRAALAAHELDGRVLEATDAYGKHLLLRFADEGDALHIHLGLFGRFRRKRGPLADPRDTCRLRLAAPDGAVAWDLSGAIESQLLPRAGERALVAKLGPDPLRPRTREKAFADNLARRRIGIGAALLDQSIVAGVGNVYRAEACFALGLDPHTPANQLTPEQVSTLWTWLKEQLRDGVRMRRIVTVPAREAGPGGRSKLRRGEATQVYRRSSCRRCGTGVLTDETGGRTLYWCPRCQPPS